MNRGTADVPGTGDSRWSEASEPVFPPPADAEMPEPAWTGGGFADNDFMLADDDDVVDTTAGAPSRPVIGPAIRRSARVWLATGLVGLVLGAGYFVERPPPYKAVTTVAIVQPSNQDAADEMLTDVALAQSRTLATTTMRSLGLPVSFKSVQGFLANYAVLAVTDRILQFTVKGKSADEAVSWARALATDFLKVRNGALLTQQAETLAALNQQVSTGQQRVTALSAQIAAAQHQPASPARTSRLALLRAEHGDAAGTLNGLEQAVQNYQATTRITNTELVRGSQVLDQAAPLPRSRFKYPVEYLGGGLAGGLVLGMAIIAVLALASTRPRRRDDVARALHAPVRLSVGPVPGGRLARGRGLAAAEDARVQRIVAHVRATAPDGPGILAIAMVAVDDPYVAALATMSLAASYARAGQKVIVADLTPDRAAARLAGITRPGLSMATAGDQQLLVAIPEPDEITPAGPVRAAASPAGTRESVADLRRAYSSADVLLTLATLDPAVGSDHLASWATDAFVVATAGRSSAVKLGAVGDMIRLAGLPIVSAILVGADKADESLGILKYATGDDELAGLDGEGSRSATQAPAGAAAWPALDPMPANPSASANPSGSANLARHRSSEPLQPRG